MGSPSTHRSPSMRDTMSRFAGGPIHEPEQEQRSATDYDNVVLLPARGEERPQGLKGFAEVDVIHVELGGLDQLRACTTSPQPLIHH